MKMLKTLSIALIGTAGIFFVLGIHASLGSPRIFTNPYLTRNGSWINDNNGYGVDQLLEIGIFIGYEINSLRGVIEHTNRSNGYFALAALTSFVGFLLVTILMKRSCQHAPPEGRGEAPRP
jgi:hypothetical protein